MQVCLTPKSFVTDNNQGEGGKEADSRLSKDTIVEMQDSVVFNNEE